MAVTWVPMPPFFLALPLRQICEPLIGPLPVNSQIRAIKSVVQKRTGESSKFGFRCKGYFWIFGFRVSAGWLTTEAQSHGEELGWTHLDAVRTRLDPLETRQNPPKPA